MNPWKDLPITAPYVHPKDAPFLERLFQRVRTSKRPRTQILPSPFVGDPEQATVYLLTQHPLYVPPSDGSDDVDDVDGYEEAKRLSLTFENPDYPFFYLDPRFDGTLGHKWWHPKLEPLIKDCGLENVAKRVMQIAYFPYYMEEYHNPRETFPTQKYSFQIVRNARDTNKKIVIMAAHTEWTTEIRLSGYMRLTSRNNTLSPGNLPDGKYEELVAAIKD